MAIRDFNIRLATAADSQAAADVVREVYEEFGFTWEESDYHADLYDLGGHYLQKGHYFWIASDETGAIGTVALELFSPVPGQQGSLVQAGEQLRIAGCDCALQRLYVRPAARGSGVGSALFEQVLDSVRGAGKTSLEIWSDKRFEDAHRLYQRYGARVIGDRICHDPDQSPEWGLLWSASSR